MTVPLNLTATLNTLRGRVITAILSSDAGQDTGVSGELVDLIHDDAGAVAALYLRVGTELSGARTTTRKIVPWSKVAYLNVRDGAPAPGSPPFADDPRHHMYALDEHGIDPNR